MNAPKPLQLRMTEAMEPKTFLSGICHKVWSF